MREMSNSEFMAKIKAKPVPGIKLGRKIGYPTVNLKIISVKGDIPYGVYTCYLIKDDKNYKGVMHYGPKSIGDAKEKNIYCEIHLLDYKEAIEKGDVKIGVLKKIRDVRKFESAEELKIQIGKDLISAKKNFKNDKQTS